MFRALPPFFHIVTLPFLKAHSRAAFVFLKRRINKVVRLSPHAARGRRGFFLMRKAGRGAGLKEKTDKTRQRSVFNANESILLLSVSVEAAE